MRITPSVATELPVGIKRRSLIEPIAPYEAVPVFFHDGGYPDITRGDGGDMRLGFWNRLAVVATVLAVAITPVWTVSSYVGRAQTRNEAFYDLCMKLAKADRDRWAAEDRCWQDRVNLPIDPDPSLWWQSALSAFVACVVIYLLIWTAIATARWVWRGRIERTSAKLGR